MGRVPQVSSDVILEDPRQVKFEGGKHGAEYLDTSQISCVAHMLPGLHRLPAQASDVASLEMLGLHAKVSSPKHMRKDWETQTMPDTTLNLKDTHIQGKSNITSVIGAGALTQEPGDIWSSVGHKVHHHLHRPGLSRHAVKEPQICSHYISSALTNRIMICFHFKAKGKQLKQGFVQHPYLHYDMQKAMDTALQRKGNSAAIHHIQTVVLGPKQCKNPLQKSGAIGNIHRGSDSKPKDFRSLMLFF